MRFLSSANAQFFQTKGIPVLLLSSCGTTNKGLLGGQLLGGGKISEGLYKLCDVK